jgi:hypothetical protein
MLAPVTHILPVTTIQRERLLPIPGTVLARRGQKVASTDVIAEANLAPEHILLDVARGLGLPAIKADKHIQRRVGEEVSENDIIAGPASLGRVVRTPRPGKIVSAGGGQVLIEIASRPFELIAGISGVIIELIPDRGAVIAATGALIQGIWGNGQIDFGLLNIGIHAPDDRTTADQLDVSLRGSVYLGGYCRDEAVLLAASDLPLRGLILSSMEASLLPLARKMRYPILLTEGFGRISMNSAAYKLLTTNERREVSISAEPMDRLKGVRPEIIIPLPTSGELPIETDNFTNGQQVRILLAPHRGQIGTLVNVYEEPTSLPNGIRARAGDVQLESGESVLLPLANLEVLE